MQIHVNLLIIYKSPEGHQNWINYLATMVVQSWHIEIFEKSRLKNCDNFWQRLISYIFKDRALIFTDYVDSYMMRALGRLQKKLTTLIGR